MTRYLTTTNPDGTCVTEAELPAVQVRGDGEGPEFFAVGYTNDGDYGTSAVIIEEDLVVTEFGAPKSLPPRDVAPPETEQSLAGRITGGISNAHPDWNFGSEPEHPEPEPEAEEPLPGPADIPPPPEMPDPAEGEE